MIGANLLELVIKILRVVALQKMAELVKHDILNALDWGVHERCVKGDNSFYIIAAAPT